jgi:hypothetical protein
MTTSQTALLDFGSIRTDHEQQSKLKKQFIIYPTPKNIQLASLSLCMQAGIPCVLVGLPGIGKTATVRAIAQQMNLFCRTLTASNSDPTDFGGIPFSSSFTLKTGETIATFRLAAPQWAVELAELGRGVLFLDELNTVPKNVEAVLMRVLLDKVVGELQLPSNIILVGAINPPEIATNGSEFSAGTSNRLCFVDWTSNAERWVEGMQNGWKMDLPPLLPEYWRDKLPEAIANVTSYIQAKQHHLVAFPKEESKRSQPWPSERTWHFATTLMAACRSIYEPFSEVEATVISGVVGTPQCHELFTYLKNLDLPKPEDLLKNIDKWQPDRKRQDIIFAIINSVNMYYDSNITASNYIQCLKFGEKLLDNEMADLAMLTLKFIFNQSRKSAIEKAISALSDKDREKLLAVKSQIMTKAGKYSNLIYA